MNIAYFTPPTACYMGDGDGIKMQAKIWARELTNQGHEVSLINPWGGYKWKEYDIIHVFGLGLWNYDVIHWGSRMNPNMVFSPIIDSITPLWKYRIATRIGCSKLRLYTQNYMMRELDADIKLYLARSEYEKKYIVEGYGVKPEKVKIVPLSYRFDQNDSNTQKKPFCLFVGTMTQERKNVFRLIDAAIKYKFHLKLAGNVGNAESEERIRKHIGECNNIEILGFVSDDQLYKLYNEAKVFALPSIAEGVGLVALEAAIHRCNIVITNLGGPQEYYNNQAYLVNPYDVDDIGSAILDALQDNEQQPLLREHIMRNYNIKKNSSDLISNYSTIL